MRATAIAEAFRQDGKKVLLLIDSLTRELIRSFCELPVEYDEQGAEGRLAQVLLRRRRWGCPCRCRRMRGCCACVGPCRGSRTTIAA